MAHRDASHDGNSREGLPAQGPGSGVAARSGALDTPDAAGASPDRGHPDRAQGADPVEAILAGAAETLWGTRHPTVEGPLQGDEPFPFLNDLADVIRERNALERLQKASAENVARLLEEARQAKEAHFVAIRPLLRAEGDDVEAIDAEVQRYLERLRSAMNLFLGAGS
jgi:hypothetical protein